MSTIINDAVPGDLIRADDWNNLLEKYDLLEGRIERLEEFSRPDQVVIYHPTPASVYAIGDELRIVGQNFGLPSQNVVVIDNIYTINQFATGSNDQLLIIDIIPNVQNISQDGRLVALTVSNPNGFVSTTFTLKQPEVTIPTGTLDVNMIASPNEPSLQAGEEYVFTYKIFARTSLDDVYTLTPVVDLGWTAEIVDRVGTPVDLANVIDPPEVFIASNPNPSEGTIVNVFVRIRIPDGTAVDTSANLNLKVTSKRNQEGLVKLSDNTNIIVGAEPPPSETLALSLLSVFSPGRKESRPDGSEVIILPGDGTEVGVTFRVTIEQAGTYSIDPPDFISNPGSLWGVRIIGASSGIFMSPPNSLINMAVHADAGASPTKLTLRVSKDDDDSIFGDIEQDIEQE